ncbi:MAG: hypothetical protein K0T01_426 [Acidimicrobiia bacterium]|nr:hypothetical protein [Acidimicrobiia bacterium]
MPVRELVIVRKWGWCRGWLGHSISLPTHPVPATCYLGGLGWTAPDPLDPSHANAGDTHPRRCEGCGSISIAPLPSAN